MTLRSLALGAPLLALLAALPACADPDDPEMVGASDEAIMGGAPDPGDPNVVDVVWLTGGNSFSECTGSLLAPNMVLTAHHCVSNLNNAVNGAIDCTQTSFTAPDSAGNFLVSTLQFLTMNPSDYHHVSEVVVPPGSTNTSFCGVDQAILILADSVQPQEAMPLVPRVDSDVKANDVYTAIGFGGTVQNGTGSGQRRRLGGLKVNCVGEQCVQIYGDQISAKHELVGDHGTCEGDSGGPALDAANRVVGVTSRGGQGCTSPIYGDVFSWAAWIKQTALHAAKVGGYTAPPWATGWPTDPAFSQPVGAACTAASSCPSNICLGDSAGSYCSRVCEAAAPCPSGYTCATIQGTQICQRIPPPPPKPRATTGGIVSAKSGCSVQADDPTTPVPWLTGAGLAALALLRRRRPR
jgi:MYXO-CTERM domain-containing protein